MSDMRKFISTIEKAMEAKTTPSKQPQALNEEFLPGSINHFTKLIEGTLMEGRHDDLMKQTFESLQKYMDHDDPVIADGTVHSINDIKNHWERARKKMNESNFPNTWKYFIADTLRNTLLLHLVYKLGIDDPKLKKKIKKDNISSLPNGRNVYIILQKLEHFLSLDYQPIRDFDLNSEPTNYLTVLENLEEEWRESLNENWVEPTGSEKLIIDLGKYKWFDLGRGACRDEGEAMGHCGNVPSVKSGDTIFSLRQVKNKGGKELHRPSLTFIANNGILGEMKGRANKKPNERYHPYIVELLKSDYVSGIKGGGYMPQSNFHPDDLSPQHYKEVVDVKGEEFMEMSLFSKLKKIMKDYKEGNANASMVVAIANETIYDLYDEGEIEYTYEISGTDENGNFIADVEDVLDTIEDYIGYFNGDDFLEIYTGEIFSYEDMLDEVPKETQDRVFQYLHDKYKDEIMDHLGIDEDNFDTAEIRANFDEIMQHEIDDELKMAFVMADEDATRSGIEGEMIRDMLDHVNEQLSKLNINAIDNLFDVIDNNSPKFTIEDNDVELYVEELTTFGGFKKLRDLDSDGYDHDALGDLLNERLSEVLPSTDDE